MKVIKHTNKVIDVILKDCQIMLDEKGYKIIDIYRVGVSHIQGLCNGLKKHLEGGKK